MNELMLNNLNEIKGALENLSDSDLLEYRMKILELVEECLEVEDSKKYKLNYSVSVPVNGEGDDCYYDQYGHSKTFNSKEEMNKFTNENNIQIEDIEEI